MLHHAEMDAGDRRDAAALAALVAEHGAPRPIVTAAG